MLLREVLARLHGVRGSSNQWTAKCPAHPDHHNSLSISLGDKGKLLLHCHAGCEYERIAAELGIIADSNDPRQIVATYSYRDERGTLLFEAVRYKPKAFSVRQPDGNGGYINSIKGVRRILYHLPEILAAESDQPVLIVEGEKDADRLAAIGLIATTCVSGAGKWRDEYSEQLRGRHVVLIPDNDDAGHMHSDKVALSLNGIAASVKVVELPGVPPKGDVSDYLDAGNTLEDLRALIHVATSRPNSSIRNSYDPRKTLPILDSKALYGLAGEFVATIFPHTEADKAALLIQMLVAFGNIIGRGPHFNAESTPHYTVLYALLVGNTSAAKGSSLAQVRRIYNRVDENWAQECNKGGLSSGEGLIEVIGDVDKRLFLRETEFASVLARQGRDASVLSATLRELWDDGNARVINRKHNALSASGAHVSLVGHITPEELMQRLSETDLGNGYANRFLFAYVRRSKDLPDGGNLSERAVNDLVRKIQAAKKFAESVAEMKRDDEAKKLWHSSYARLVADKGGVFGKVVARSRAQVLRLSCIYALLDQSREVKRAHLEAALALWQYCEDSARYIFDKGMTLSISAQKLYDAVLMAGKGGLTRTEQFGTFNGNLTAKELDALTDELVRARLVTKAATDEGRKPSLVAVTNYELDEQTNVVADTHSSNSLILSDEEAEAEAIREFYYRSEETNEEVL